MLGLNLTKGLRAAAKAPSFHAQLVEHGEIKVGEWQLAEVHLAAPTGIRTNAGSGLVLVVTLTVLEILAVLETHISPPHQE